MSDLTLAQIDAMGLVGENGVEEQILRQLRACMVELAEAKEENKSLNRRLYEAAGGIPR